jgi:hypothetical protein
LVKLINQVFLVLQDMAIAIGTAILPGSFKVAHATQNSNKGRRRTRASRSSFVVRSSVEEEESTPSRLSFDLSNMPEFDINRNRRANYNARRRIVQSRGVPDIHPEIFGKLHFDMHLLSSYSISSHSSLFFIPMYRAGY